MGDEAAVGGGSGGSDRNHESLLEQNKRVLSIIEKVILRRGRMQTGEDPLGARSTAGAGVRTALPPFDGSATQLRVFNRLNLQPWVSSIYKPRACPAGATEGPISP